MNTELATALLGIAASIALAVRGLPAVFDRLARARETTAKAHKTTADAELLAEQTHASALETLRGQLAEERASRKAADEHAARVEAENRSLRARLQDYRGNPIREETKR